MKRIILYIIFSLALLLFGCRERGVKGSGNVITESREIEDFNEVEVSGAYNINISVGGNTSLSVSAEDNLQKFITTRIVNERLIIENSRNLSPKRKIEINITTPELDLLNSSGICNIYVEGIDEQTFTLDLSGAGVTELYGKVENFNVDLAGASLLEARELFARFVEIDANDASQAEIYVSERLTVDLSGNGNIDYYGDPLEVNSAVSGIGQITKREW